MREKTVLNSKTICACMLDLFLVFSISFLIPASHAEELLYDEKLEFTFKIKQITGHMVSALDNVDKKQYTLAKMHLIHPMAQHSDIVDFLSEDSVCAQKLSLVLQILQHTEPEFDYQDIHKRFSHVFKVLNACTDLVVGIDVDSHFYMELADKLLEQSISEYEQSTHVMDGMGKKMKYQDALGLVIRAHMLVKSDNISNVVDYDNVRNNFQNLFLAYQNNSSLSDIAVLTNQIRNSIILDGSLSFQDNAEKYELTTPTVYLASKSYATGLKMLELRGENFNEREKVVIEYFDNDTEELQTISGIVTSDGIFSIPFEIVDDTFDESIMFTITVGDFVLYQVLSIL